MDKLLSFQGKQITNFFSIVQGSANEKKYKFYGFTLLIRANNYETVPLFIHLSGLHCRVYELYKTAETYMNPQCQ